MSIYLDEKNPGKHKLFDDASQDIVEYVRYLEVIAVWIPHSGQRSQKKIFMNIYIF